MIIADFFKSPDNKLKGFSVSGHSMTAESGQDICCASVSSAVMLTANTVTDSFKLDAKVRVEENEIKLKLGDDVKVLSMGLKGVVNSLPDAKGNLFVQCGIIRSKVNISDLELIEETNPYETKSKNKGSGISKSKTVDEAIHELDKYLDDAYLAHLPSVRIVHGKGTGALRSAVVNHLKRIKYIDSFRQGEFGEGDAGVTIAVFKEK